jgi:ABC-type amino acid transport substrate-binding protein
MKKFILSLILLTLSLPAWAGNTKESAYDRVMRTNTLRCGYFVGDPYLIKDPNTGALSGIWFDYMEAVGKALKIKIDWAEEIGLGDFGVALDSNRVDAMCLGIWVDPDRAKIADYITPISYHAAYVWVRENDDRFDRNFDELNSSNTTITYLDGDIAASVADEDFPDAKRLTLPQLSQVNQALENVATKKADFTIFTPEIVEKFNKNRNNKLRKADIGYPIRTFPESIAVKRGETELVNLLNYTTNFLINNGKIDRILKKYESSPNSFMRTSKPYELKK